MRLLWYNLFFINVSESVNFAVGGGENDLKLKIDCEYDT